MEGLLLLMIPVLFIVLQGYKIGEHIQEKNYKQVGLNVAFMMVWVIILVTKLLSISVNIYN